MQISSKYENFVKVIDKYVGMSYNYIKVFLNAKKEVG